jgi:hypothetical protein
MIADEIMFECENCQCEFNTLPFTFVSLNPDSTTMENSNSSIDNLIAHAEDYLKTRQRLTQHVVTEKVIVLSSSMITAYVLFVFFAMAAIFASWGLASWISLRLNDPLAGYWWVSGGYALLGSIMLLFRNAALRNPIMNSMVRNIYTNSNEQDN